MTAIISIHSFRGGTGKSNLTANLGVTIASQGQRVAIIDTDIQSPGIHVLFGLDEKNVNYTLNDYLWGRCTIKDVAYDVSSSIVASGTQETIAANSCLYLVPSSIKVSEISQVLRQGYDAAYLNESFQELIHALKLDYLLIDTHPGLNEETLLSVGMSQLALIILRPDSQDFQGTAVTVDVARKLGVPKVLLIVNKALPNMNFDTLQEKVERIYNAPVAGIVPISTKMFQLGSSGIFCLRYPDDLFSQTVKSIARRIISTC